jgi:DHA1 family bicyclomycin/chloramphenicol resistance-like MFS transporter
MHQVIVVSSFSIVSMLSGAILKYMTSLQCAVMGISLSIIGVISFLLGSLVFPGAFITTISVSVFSVGFALFYPVIFTASLSIFPSIKATSLIMSKRAIIIALVVFTTGHFYDGKLSTVAQIMFCVVSIAGLLMGLSLFKNKR